jgi:hypothetical protein
VRLPRRRGLIGQWDHETVTVTGPVRLDEPGRNLCARVKKARRDGQCPRCRWPIRVGDLIGLTGGTWVCVLGSSSAGPPTPSAREWPRDQWRAAGWVPRSPRPRHSTMPSCSSGSRLAKNGVPGASAGSSWPTSPRRRHRRTGGAVPAGHAATPTPEPATPQPAACEPRSPRRSATGGRRLTRPPAAPAPGTAPGSTTRLARSEGHDDEMPRMRGSPGQMT